MAGLQHGQFASFFEAMIDYVEQPGSAQLDPHIECLWYASSKVPLLDRQSQRIVPDACPELVIQLGDTFDRWMDTAWLPQPKMFLAGTLTSPWLLRPGVRVQTLGARFRPAMVRDFFAVDMKTATDQEVPLELLVGPVRSRELLQSLNAADTTDQRFQHFAEWLSVHAPTSELGATTPLSKRAVRIVLNAKGKLSVDQLATELACSPRTLERSFARDLGITPKLFARIVRLSAVLANLEEPVRTNTVDLALEMGFFDQSHLLRDARLLAGRRLSVPRSEDGVLAQHFTDPQRLQQLLKAAYEGS